MDKIKEDYKFNEVNEMKKASLCADLSLRVGKDVFNTLKDIEAICDSPDDTKLSRATTLRVLINMILGVYLSGINQSRWDDALQDISLEAKKLGLEFLNNDGG